MRIALVTDWFLPRLGGLELQVRDLADRLAREGHEPRVITPTPADATAQGPLQTGDVELPPGVSIHRLEVPLVPGLRVALTPRLPGAVERALRATQPDVVHVHAGIGSPTALAGTLVADRLGLPLVLTCHSVLGPYRHLYRAADLACGWLARPHVVSAVSATVARELEALVPHGRVRVLPNGVDPEAWRLEPLPGDEGELRLVTVMRLQRRKRGGALLDVVARAARRLDPDVRVTLEVVGDGPRAGTLRRRARGLGLDDRVAFAGYRSRDAIRDRFARADAFVLASIQESFGIAALEARSAGLPVVARGDAGVAELLAHGTEALLAGSDDELVEHLVRLGRDLRLRRRLARHNRDVPPAFGWTATLPRHLEAYRDARRGTVRREARGARAAMRPAMTRADEG